ncbi:MAG: pyridoxine 5'-phosphate synthase [Candidatus Zixiibacteriota bacterium]|nr:MAG: pyridoxine 5'-phosphate synthase [candidate division Zixibacteria bacterium]
MALISIKLDQVAALRSLRQRKQPDPVQAAVLAELAGADGVACQLREDRQYIRDRDVYLLREIVKTRLNLYMAPVDELYQRAIEVKPYMVTLMPFSDEQVAVRNGIDFEENRDLYAEFAGSLKEAGICACYFVDPDADAVKAAARAKVDAVELNAFPYVSSETVDAAETELERIEQTAQLALKLGISAHCGNNLDYKNIRPLVKFGIVDEFTVGHAIISRGLLVGLDRAVREIVDIVHPSNAG